MFPFLRTVQRCAPALLLILVASLVTGCGAGVSAPTTNSFVQAGTMAGQLHGGNQPIIGGTISLYAVGTSGYGSPGTLYAQTVSNNDAFGSFNFIQTTGTSPTGPPSSISASYACPTGSPTNSDPQMYLFASGGETQGVGNGANPAAAFVVAIGKCSQVASLFIDINEVTSVATMAALQQYFNPVTESFGYPNTTQTAQGFANGVATIANLADIATGAAATSNTYTASAGSVLGASNAITVTATPEINKVNLVANILAACVNNTSNTAPNCGTLFADAVPPVAANTSQPTQVFTSITPSNEDTAQALYFMMTNPASGGSATNMRGLFGMISGNAPFQPAYATAPTDWTIGISYTSNDTCTNKLGNTSTGKFLTGINNPTVDASGNVWAANIGSATGNLFQISPTGMPLTCGLGKLADSASGITIDTNGYVWVGSAVKVSSFYHLYKWNPSSGVLDSTWPTSGTAVNEQLAADGNNNIFYTATTNTSTFDTTSGSLNQFAGAGAIGASPTNITSTQVATLYSAPYWMAVDSSDRVWIGISLQGTPTSQGLFDVYPSSNTGGSTYMAGASDGSHTGFEAANVATANTAYTYSPYGVAVGASDVYVGNGKGSGGGGPSHELEIVAPGTTPGSVTITNSARSAGGLLTPRGIAVDGASNVWIADNDPSNGNYVTGSTTGSYSIGELSSTGVGIAATSSSGYGNNTGGYQKDSSLLPIGARGISVDPTGNVWIGQNSSGATNLLELVGVGVPTVTPLSVAAMNGALGQMP